MTVSKDYNKHIYEGNGLTRDWPYDFDLPITAAGAPDTSLIHVFRTNLRGEVTEVTAFSVDAETGTLTYPTSGSPLESGEKLTILRLLDVRQQFFDPSNQANLYPETLEDNTDRLVMMVQQLQEETDRAVKVSVSTDLDEEDTTAEGIFEARDIALSAAAASEGYANMLPAIADELDVNIVLDEADLRAKLALIGASNATLVIAKPIPIAEDLAIPSNVALSFKKTGQLQPASGKTLTVNGPIDAGLWQIFDGEGTVDGTPQIPYVYPEWFGADSGGTEDAAPAITAAVAFAGTGGTILFSPGTYLIEAGLTQLTGQRWRASSGRHSTTIKKGANMDPMYTMATGAVTEGIDFDGNGATYTGAGIYMPAGKDSVLRDVRCENTAGISLDFADESGVGCVVENFYGLTTSPETIPALRLGSSTTSAFPKFLNGIWLSGGLIDLTKDAAGRDVCITNFFIRNILSSADTGRVYVSNGRVASLTDTTTIKGKQMFFTNVAFSGPVVLDGSVGFIGNNCIFGAKITETNELDGAGNNYTSRATEWDVTWTQASGTQPSLGNATVLSLYRKQGGVCKVQLQITFGSTTTFGNNTDPYEFSLPLKAAGGFVQRFLAGYITVSTGMYPVWGTIGPNGKVLNLAAMVAAFQKVRNTFPASYSENDAILLQFEYYTS